MAHIHTYKLSQETWEGDEDILDWRGKSAAIKIITVIIFVNVEVHLKALPECSSIDII